MTTLPYPNEPEADETGRPAACPQQSPVRSGYRTDFQREGSARAPWMGLALAVVAALSLPTVAISTYLADVSQRDSRMASALGELGDEARSYLPAPLAAGGAPSKAIALGGRAAWTVARAANKPVLASAARTVSRSQRSARIRRGSRSSYVRLAGARSAVSLKAADRGPTYVYNNGGSLLGLAPLVRHSLPPGRHVLTLWNPITGGRALKVVTVRAGRELRLTQHVPSRARFAYAN